LIKKKDRYKRNIGICYVKDEDINKWVVKNGHAIAYKRYFKKYVFDEQPAKENKLRIGKGTFVDPEKWRKNMN
jgi:Micrococcal nuclease (thermonuclease) homologs